MFAARMFAWFSFILASVVSIFGAKAGAQTVAFPGAEGAGCYATGGRGGTVYKVTNLNSSGTGSIVDACSEGNRIIVFEVGGTIDLEGTILRPEANTTIAGQTAPGDGICLKGRVTLSNDDIILRYIRIRVDQGAANSSGDAVDINGGSNIIVDHVTGSYARDEVISSTNNTDRVTVQWCIMSEALNFEDHSYGSLIRGEYGQEKSYHHNLYAHNRSRNPRPGNYTTITDGDSEGLHFDFRNNVVYNWMGSYGGYNADGDDTVSHYNFIGNYYQAGTDSGSSAVGFQESSPEVYGYFADNVLNGTIPADPWDFVRFDDFTEAEITAYKARSAELDIDAVTTSDPFTAYTDVLNEAGCSFPARDSLDARIVQDVIDGTGAIIDDVPADGYPALTSGAALTDTDDDGMPDDWETTHGLNNISDADQNLYTLHDDYTNIEVWLNWGVFGLEISKDTTPPDAPASLTATAGAGSISLDWDDNAESDLLGYYVYRSTASGGPYVLQNANARTSSAYKDTNVSGGVTYYYVITAVDSSGNESAQSSEASAEPSNSAPAFDNDPITETGAYADTAYSSTLADDASDSDTGDTLTFSKIDGPAWLTVASGGTLSGTPAESDEGVNTWTVQVKDGNDAYDQATLYITVAIAGEPAAHWPLNESSGSVMADEGSSALDGTLYNMDDTAWSAAKWGNGLTFDGVDDYAIVAHNSAIDFATESFTVCFWLKHEATGSGAEEEGYLEKGTITYESGVTTGKRYNIYSKEGSLYFAIDDNSAKTQIGADTTGTFHTDDWVFVTAVRDAGAGEVLLYADAVEVVSDTDDTGDISQEEPMYIGRYAPEVSNPCYMTGSLDEIRIYNYALTQTEIAALMAVPVEISVFSAE